MEKLCLAATVANLEGLDDSQPDMNYQGFPKTVSVAHLDIRVRALEKSHSFTSPPPIQEPSWDSLAWRVARLWRRAQGRTNMLVTPRQILPIARSEISLDEIRKVVNGIVGRRPTQPWSSKCDMDDMTMEDVLQRLCYLAGERHIKLRSIPTEPADIYATAVDVSLETEGCRSFSKPPVPFSWPGPRDVAKKPCCDCCNCGCHRVQLPPQPRVIRTVRSFSSTSSNDSSVRMKKTPRFQWLKQLFCWRKTKVSSKASISSSSRTMTVD